MGHLTVLTAGNGGIRFIAGLVEVRPEEEIHIIANVGNDCELWGLYCCPDIDVVLHTLAGQEDPYRVETGRGTSFECFETIRKLGMPSWFRIPDRDLATHLVRTEMLRSGACLEEATRQLADRFGLGVELIPASNDPVRTKVHTPDGALHGLQYASQRESPPPVTGASYEGADAARAPERAVRSILEADRVILAPGHPVLGIGAILAIPDIRNALARTRAGVVAISPLVGSKPVGEDGAGLLNDAGTPSAAAGLAGHLRGIIDSLVIHTSDLPALDAVRATGVDAWADNVLLNNREVARKLAGRVANSEKAVARKR